jgi:hypothetical protein
MRNEQNAVLASLRRAQQFLDTNKTLLDAVNKSTRKQLDDVVTQLSDLSIAQESGARGSKGETARQRASLLVLRRNYMAPVAELAKLKLRDVPEFAALMLPPASSTPNRTVTAAYAMADAATAHAQVFIDNGLPATFADDLRAAAPSVIDSIATRSTHLVRRIGATAGLASEEKRGRTILRVLNALIMVRIANDPQLIAEWTSTKMVRRKSGPAAGSQADTPPADVAPIHSIGTPATSTSTSTSTPILTPTPSQSVTQTVTPTAAATHTASPTPTPAPATPPVAVAA